MARMVQPDLPQPDAQWWITLAQRLNIEDKVEQFFHDATTPHNVLDRVVEVDGDMQYILFVLVRHWIPIVLPPPGRERIAKHDPDYWLESAQILNAAVTRLRELKPLIDLLTTVNPLGPQAGAFGFPDRRGRVGQHVAGHRHSGGQLRRGGLYVDHQKLRPHSPATNATLQTQQKTQRRVVGRVFAPRAFSHPEPWAKTAIGRFSRT